MGCRAGRAGVEQDRRCRVSTPESHAASGHLAINPDPYRTRAAAMADDENPKVRALAEVVRVMCDRYDELRAVFGVKPGQIVRWPGG